MRGIVARIGVVVLLVSAQTAWAQDADARRITVVGSGSSTAVPDVAIVRLGVEARDASAGVAMVRMNEALGAVIDSLGGMPEDVQTSTLMLQQDYDRSGSLSSANPGYVAHSVVTLRTGDMAGLGEMLDAAVDAGANRIEGISFTVADPAAAMTEARMAAIADAQIKAQMFADTAGVVLGDLITMTEGMGGGPVPRVATMESVVVAPGTVAIDAQVTLVYAING